MKKKGLLIILIFLGNFVVAQEGNFGLGPLEIRPQFVVNQPYLVMSPENTRTITSGESRLSFGIEIANTFVNTQGPTGQITKIESSKGLTLENFLDIDGNTVRGFSLYLDVESKRKNIKYRYGLSNSFEIKIQLPFVSFDGGVMDNTIELSLIHI